MEMLLTSCQKAGNRNTYFERIIVESNEAVFGWCFDCISVKNRIKSCKERNNLQPPAIHMQNNSNLSSETNVLTDH